MRFSAFVTLSIVAASVSAIAIPSINDIEARDYVPLLKRAPVKGGFFHTGDSSSSSGSSSSSSDSSSSHHGSQHGSNPPSPGRTPSPHNSVHSHSSDDSISADPHIKFSVEGYKQLDRLGNLTNAEREKIEKEHKILVKQHMKKLGATHTDIHKMAHIRNSLDQKVHITATFKKPVAGPKGGIKLEDIPSSWQNDKGEEKSGTRHHVYVNKENPEHGAEYVKNHMPMYHSKLQEKQGLGPNDQPVLRRRALRRRGLVRAAARYA
ncbi:hypothetical protein CVT24_013317 [Panaeolus cyanescens]|uniref:Inhibitor I9 domain-containing protein n=1 Tax=Panaeolus cyanescens TaxID=181874 RepID=A0A409WD69_9AGAR|nr:hypothetical protein CVT24_013317 [Panaeolus cyanescens]